MIALLFIALMVMAARRGYKRGAPKELIDLLVLIVGLPIAFRLGAPFGDALFASLVPLAK